MTKEELIKRLDAGEDIIKAFSEFVWDFELQPPESAKDDYRIGILAGYYQFRTAIKAELEREV